MLHHARVQATSSHGGWERSAGWGVTVHCTPSCPGRLLSPQAHIPFPLKHFITTIFFFKEEFKVHIVLFTFTFSLSLPEQGNLPVYNVLVWTNPISVIADFKI